MARGPAWLGSRGAALLLVGFAVNLAGLVGGALWLAPAEKAADRAAAEIARESMRARLIRSATVTAEISDHLGSLVFTAPVGDDAADPRRDTLAELFTRAIDRSHEAVRAYIADLAVAGAIDYAPTLARYERLVAAERADFNRDTYRAANAFAAELAMAMVDAEGEATMTALKLQPIRREAKAAAARRRLVLTLTAVAGWTVIFVATLAGAGAGPPAPSSKAGRTLEAALRRLRPAGARA